MRRRSRLIGMCLIAAVAGDGVALAQGRGGSAWSTPGGDAQRTAWVRTDPKVTKESMQKGFQFLWKTKLENQPKGLNSLTQPLILPNIISYKGFKALAYLGGSDDNVYATDYDLNRMFWKVRLSTASTAAATAACPGGLTAVTRAATLTQPTGGGRGTALPAPPPAPGGARGGAPGTLPPGAGAPAPPAAGRGAGPGGPPAAPTGPNAFLNAFGGNVYAISSGGMVHALNAQTGEDLIKPTKLLPPNAKVIGSAFIGDTLYAATTDNCGGAANGVYALTFAGDTPTVSSWDAKGAAVVGSVAPTFTTDGKALVATGAGSSEFANAIVALDGKSLAGLDWFSPGTPFVSSPVVFSMGGKELVAAANKDGRIYLLDAASLGGADHKTPLAKSPQYAAGTSDFGAGSLATWQDADGTRWLLAATAGAPHADATFAATNGSITNGAIVAFKVVDQGGTPSLQPGWISRDLASPVAPLVMNGIVFAVASGEAAGTPQMTAAQRAQRSKPAVLYALDAATGKELWNSGTTITSFVHGIGPSGGDSQIYVVTYDGMLYAFGIPLEH